MRQPIVIAFHPNGEIQYTRNSEFMPFGGEGAMERVTDIRKEDYGSRYYIHWMRGPWAGLDHTRDMSRNYFTPDELLDMHMHDNCPKGGVDQVGMHGGNNRMLFITYEAAVSHEIALLNRMRLADVRF